MKKMQRKPMHVVRIKLLGKWEPVRAGDIILLIHDDEVEKFVQSLERNGHSVRSEPLADE